MRTTYRSDLANRPRPLASRLVPAALVPLATCAGCGRPFVRVQPRQRHCRPSCRTRRPDDPAGLFPAAVATRRLE